MHWRNRPALLGLFLGLGVWALLSLVILAVRQVGLVPATHSPGGPPPRTVADADTPAHTSGLRTQDLVDLSRQFRDALAGLRKWDGLWSAIESGSGAIGVMSDAADQSALLGRVLAEDDLSLEILAHVDLRIRQAYTSLDKAPSIELALLARARAYAVVDGTRRERLAAIRQALDRARRSGRKEAQDLDLLELGILYGGASIERLSAFFDAIQTLAVRDLCDGGLTTGILVDTLDDTFLVARTVAGTRWEPAPQTALTEAVAAYEVALESGTGPDAVDVGSLIEVFWHWGWNDGRATDPGPVAGRIEALTRRLTARHPQARPALDDLLAAVRKLLTDTQPKASPSPR